MVMGLSAVVGLMQPWSEGQGHRDGSPPQPGMMLISSLNSFESVCIVSRSVESTYEHLTSSLD